MPARTASLRQSFPRSLRPFLAASSLFLAAMLSAFLAPSALAEAPVRIVVIGLVHGHAQGLFSSLAKNTNVQLVGIAEPDTALAGHYEQQFHLDHKLFFTDADKMLGEVHADAALVYTDILDHRKAIEVAARHGVSSMVEKPLATTVPDALAIRRAAREHHVQVLVNYETTWYSSNSEALRDADQGKLGAIRRVVVHDGHQGPKEIGVGPEFLGWLTDPVKNGAGSMFDFGCYGADLMTVLMKGETPQSVTAVALTDKPETYPRVDDDATIIVRYPKTQAVLQPSWNWPFSRKDMEVYGATGYAITEAADRIRTRFAGDKTENEAQAPPIVGAEENSLDYLAAVIRGKLKPKGDLTALDTNMIVVQILAAARESVKTGRTVRLQPLPN
jgi:predicted dehydrogenase